MASYITKTLNKFSGMHQRHSRYTGMISLQRTSSLDPRTFVNYSTEGLLVGMDGPVAELTNKLSKCDHVSILGMGGMGKTVLAQAVYDKIKGGFHCEAFVHIGLRADVMKVLVDIFEEFHIDICGHKPDQHELISQLQNFLVDKRCLFVIDDIWDKETCYLVQGSLTIGVVGSVVGLIMLACLAALIWKVLKLRSQCRRGHIREFTYRELASATREFADGRKLGQGAFGVVYKGAVMLQDEEVEVAIKKNLNVVSDESRAAFKNEVDIMKPLNHLNIIRLVGWCDNRSSLLLVYELVEDRNLEDRLYGGGASVSSGSGLVLDWRQRYNILVGIASGLDYLHNKCVKTVLHRDIKPGNVMLDRDFNAKLCDFGLVTQLTHAVTSRSTGNIIGTPAYMDPSFEENGKVIRESDVYSFGVLLLEVVCGVKPKLIPIDRDTKNSLIEMVREYEKKNAILNAADQHLRGKFDDQIKGALLIGLHCVKTNRGDRPTIQIVLSKLSGLRDSYVVV
ncbi:probable L-type lectin-domain containing receptor kinase S.5 [Triticum aestivum]|uniref:probable L-type lectin-domain containing receptor kinase S.5 n=1 Tax=Triticum aestivum TaxID=4565 RepID=UPI001D01F3D6|nr:probable L-type lectin-domain containing receptor kinase S.5 [Triticum aestivum]